MRESGFDAIRSSNRAVAVIRTVPADPLDQRPICGSVIGSVERLVIEPEPQYFDSGRAE